jgi:hypothetical protein
MAIQSVQPDVKPHTTGRVAIGRMVACFVAAYVTCTVLAAGTTIAYAAVNHTFAADQAATNPVKAPSFAATVPYHPLIMLAVWPLFAWLYFRRRGHTGARAELRETLSLSVGWLVGAAIVDFVGFVVIRNPWSLTPHQFYVDYQPWIGLIYLAIFASPWLRLTIRRRVSRPRS